MEKNWRSVLSLWTWALGLNSSKPNQPLSIPPLNVNGIIYSDNTDMAAILNDYFIEKSSLDDNSADLNIPDCSLNSISITANEV